LALMQQPASGIALGSSAWPGLGIRRPADLRVLAATGAAAVFTDLAVRSGVTGLAGTLLIVLVSASLLGSGRVSNPQARALIVAAPVFGLWLFVRTSPWLVPLDILASGGLLVLGASFASGGTVLDLSIPSALGRALHAIAHGVAAPPFLAAPLDRIRRRLHAGRSGHVQWRAVLRGVGLAVPVLLVLGLLLASADAVFASIFRLDVDVDPATIVFHAALLLVGAWGMAGLLRLASAEPAARSRGTSWRLGSLEATIVLGSVVALFATFAGAQLVALSGGGRRVIETAGLTYADYARSGFFQLLWVAGLTLCLLLAVRAATDLGTGGARRRFVALSEIVVVLTLLIVVVAVRRMHLYEQAYGLTMLRLYVELFTLWIGAVFVMLGLSLAGAWARRAWLVPAAVAAALVLLLGLNVANPEAIVVRHNVAHAERTGRFDPAYLAELSEDAVPTLVGELPRLAGTDRAEVLRRLCPPELLRFKGWAAYNVSLDVAYEKLVAACQSGGLPG
jgi:hypothetical protein